MPQRVRQWPYALFKAAWVISRFVPWFCIATTTLVNFLVLEHGSLSAGIVFASPALALRTKACVRLAWGRASLNSFKSDGVGETAERLDAPQFPHVHPPRHLGAPQLHDHEHLALLQFRLHEHLGALRPELQREAELMREVLASGSGSQEGPVVQGRSFYTKEMVQAMADAVAPNKAQMRQRLLDCSEELLELACSTRKRKEAILKEGKEVKREMKLAVKTATSKLLAAKEMKSEQLLKKSYQALNQLKTLGLALKQDTHELIHLSCLSAFFEAVCRKVLPVRQIDPMGLQFVEASRRGYLRILNFYALSDASSYCFGALHYEGANWLTRNGRNIAILEVKSNAGQVIYNNFAVSGQWRRPGAKLASEDGPLRAIEAEFCGEPCNRRNDAEFKLLAEFCECSDASWQSMRATGVLWSKRPLCQSCAGAVQQLLEIFPNLSLDVVVEEPD